jgi:polysaccharide biosynthesis protein PelF
MSSPPPNASAAAKPIALPKAAEADVALLLEGTYPYVSGGVSSWVHQIIRGCPDLKFAAYFLGSQASDYGAIRFELPPNLVHLEVNYLFKSGEKVQPKAIKGNAEVFEGVRCMHARWREQGAAALAGQEVDKSNPDLSKVLGQLGKSLTEEQFLHSEQAWKFITENFGAHCTDPSFVDYFWTVRIMHTPIFTLQRVVDHMIPVKAFHTISTGYAGLLGAMCARRFNKPLVLSEHGIYTKERKIDLMAAQWIADRRGPLAQDATQISYFRELWPMVLWMSAPPASPTASRCPPLARCATSAPRKCRKWCA